MAVLPEFDLDAAAGIARCRFGLDGLITALDGERDLNYLIEDRRGKFVFKIANRRESPAWLECQHQALRRVASAQVFDHIALPLASVDQRDFEWVSDARGNRHLCRVLPYIDGRLLLDIQHCSTPLLEDLGAKLAALDRALDGFAHPALARPLLWQMERAESIVDSYRPLLAKAGERDLVDFFLHRYRQRLSVHRHGLRRAIIHNDANRGNVLTDADESRVVSIIDFGDMIESWLAVEAAVAAAYVMLEQDDPLACAFDLIRGYHGSYALRRDEVEMLPEFIAMRLCMSVCICAHQRRLEPDNAYLGIDFEAALVLLDQLQSYPEDDFRSQILTTCNY